MEFNELLEMAVLDLIGLMGFKELLEMANSFSTEGSRSFEDRKHM